uniref:Uncharacterized protein n=1 Tax=Timema monikensis TaxID=170555 RepID=A0A7R9ECH7_9NEOP|nr:unnamed protein product [Timema monikensis]
MVVQNGPQAQQQLTQQMQALNLYPSGGSTEPPPPYPSYTASIQSRQSPTQDYRKSPSSGIYSGSPSPVSSPAPPSVARPTPLQAWGARQAKTQPPIIMQSVKSTQVQKPVLQTAIAPTAPPLPGSAGANSSPPPPSYATSIQQKQQQHHKGGGTVPTPASSPVTVPTTDPPSYASTMQALAAQRGQVLPPPPYGPEPGAQVATVESSVSPRPSASVQRKFSPATSRSESPESPPLPPTTSSSVAVQNGASERRTSAYKVNHQSPIPERKRMSKEKEEERRDCKVRNYSPQAFKFFMEQHIENVIKSYKQRKCESCSIKFVTLLQRHIEEIITLTNSAQVDSSRLLYATPETLDRLEQQAFEKHLLMGGEMGPTAEQIQEWLKAGEWDPEKDLLQELKMTVVQERDSQAF